MPDRRIRVVSVLLLGAAASAAARAESPTRPREAALAPGAGPGFKVVSPVVHAPGVAHGTPGSSRNVRRLSGFLVSTGRSRSLASHD